MPVRSGVGLLFEVGSFMVIGLVLDLCCPVISCLLCLQRRQQQQIVIITITKARIPTAIDITIGKCSLMNCRKSFGVDDAGMKL